MSDKVRVTPIKQRAKWAQQETEYDQPPPPPTMKELIARSSLGVTIRRRRLP